jgi:hypothetical protein
MGSSLGLAPGAAAGAEPSPLAAKRHDLLFVTRLALKAKEAKGGNAAFEVSLKLLGDIVRQRSVLGPTLGDESAEMLLDDLVTRGELGSAP